MIGLFIAYQLWFTNQVADSRATSIATDVNEGIKALASPKNTKVDAIEVQSVGYRELSLGVGFYPGAALPGEAGNFAVAGHRATNGEPFARFERLEAGDLVYVQTSAGWFEYELRENKKISDRATWVLDAQPKGINLGSSQIITLTTCDPRWNSVRRWACREWP